MQSVCSGNSGSLGFVTLPQYHSSTSKQAVIKHRRLLEDKLLGSLDTSEVSLSFSDTGHGGDRRKKSQQCVLIICLAIVVG